MSVCHIVTVSVTVRLCQYVTLSLSVLTGKCSVTELTNVSVPGIKPVVLLPVCFSVAVCLSVDGSRFWEWQCM
jgi:hypothetical protein